MATATASKSARNRTCQLLEIASGHGKVDYDNAVIHDAKIVGLQSRNLGKTIGLDPAKFNGALDEPYSYSRQALESAIPMYEGALLRIKHPRSTIGPDGRRQMLEKDGDRDILVNGGVARNVRFKEDGLYCDLHLFKANPRTPLILEMADKTPDKIALSHNAEGKPVLRGGRAVIEEITGVKSIDIIDEKPGTTNGLFESHEEQPTVKRTIKQLIEALPSKSTADSVKRKALLEMGADCEVAGKKMTEMEMDAPVDADPATASPDSQVSDALRSAMVAVLDDDSLDSAAKVGKIKEILKMKDKLDGTEPTGAETPEDDMGGDDDVDAQESLARVSKTKGGKQLIERLERLEGERDELAADKHARTLLESAGREITPVRVDAVKAAKSDASRKSLIETWPSKDDEIRRRHRPATSAPLQESDLGEQAKDGEEFSRRLGSR